MKNYFALIFCVFLFSGIKAQQNSGVQTMRDNRYAGAEAKQPDPSQLVYITPPELLKNTTPAVQPDPSQIVTITPPDLLKPSATAAVQPDPSQIVNETPPELLKQNKIMASPAPVEQPK